MSASRRRAGHADRSFVAEAMWTLRGVVRPALLLGLSAGFTIRELDEAPAGPTPEDCKKPVNRIVKENCLPGSDSSEWDINGAGSATIQGFAMEQSYDAGERVVFKIKTPSTDYRIDIYRMGWYGGAGARKLASFKPSATLPQLQPECYKDDETLLVDCGTWAESASWTVPRDAVTGVYFARLVRLDLPMPWRTDASQIAANPKFANWRWDYSKMPPCGDAADCPGLEHAYGAQRRKQGPEVLMRNALKEPHASHVYFVVRAPADEKTDLLFQTIDTTSHAYNNYASPSTYGVLPLAHHNFSMPASWVVRRSYKKSYNSPLITRDTRAVNVVFNSEYPAIRWLERHGYSIQYWTGVDAHTRGEEITRRAKVYLSVGHDEYWSGEQRAHVEAARDRGTHLIFWSGNEVYWKVRWEASPVDGQAMRTMVVYKESQESVKLDPDAATWTGTFRDSRPFNPQGGNPENSLTGTLFTVNAWRNDPLEVPGVYAPLRFWRDTEVAKLRPSQKAVLLKGLLGHEWDEDMDNGFRPPGLIRLSKTTVDNVQFLIDTGGCFDSGSATHHLVMYKAKSGAIVFGAGTVQWTWGLDNFHDEPTGGSNMLENEYNTRIGVDLAGPDPVIQQATANLFADMQVWPAILGEGLIRPTASSDTMAPRVTAMGFEAWPSSGLWATATDEGGVVAALEWSSDEVRWHPLERATGAAEEEWRAALPEDAVSVWVRAVDDSLNIGPAAQKTRAERPSKPSTHTEL
eukprot:TRINITY_DN31603_c0_g5_i1.p1 TRINITY_DN31603_c0_g5~~TRINITY_DN31603_c0_g5_i1.p1  ORF type:complete len:746 (+),score=133.22 TRINITY_DN31603_c0_g5_i1:153-2390(+)